MDNSSSTAAEKEALDLDRKPAALTEEKPDAKADDDEMEAVDVNRTSSTAMATEQKREPSTSDQAEINFAFSAVAVPSTITFLPPRQAGYLIHLEDRIGASHLAVSNDVHFDEGEG